MKQNLKLWSDWVCSHFKSYILIYGLVVVHSTPRESLVGLRQWLPINKYVEFTLNNPKSSYRLLLSMIKTIVDTKFKQAFLIWRASSWPSIKLAILSLSSTNYTTCPNSLYGRVYMSTCSSMRNIITTMLARSLSANSKL